MQKLRFWVAFTSASVLLGVGLALLEQGNMIGIVLIMLGVLKGKQLHDAEKLKAHS